MSIWATLWSTSANWHAPDCNVWQPGPPDHTDPDTIPFGMLTNDGTYHQNPTIACDHNCGPIAYTASHLWPDPTDRLGLVEVAAIPGELDPDHTDTGPIDTYHPYLRLSVTNTTDDTTVILDLAQVRELHETLSHWLDWQIQGEPT